MKPRLSVLISTIDDRITSVPSMLLPPDERVRYIVMWQHPHSISVEAKKANLLLEREDVLNLRMSETGLAKSRNAAICASQTPIVLIADDDVTYKPNAFDKILQAFDENPDCDVLCFRAEDREGNPLKPYADEALDYELRPRGYAASSIEIAFRKHYKIPEFDTRFGLGSQELVCGEEDVFLHECMMRKLKVRFVPITICSTNGDTTSTRMARHPKYIKSKGAALRYVHGRSGAWLRSLKYAIQAPFGEKIWRFKLLAQGIHYLERTGRPAPLVSVIIPYRNRVKTLPRLFRSLLSVDYSPLEIILVDNGSTDGSLELCEEFRAKYADNFNRVAILSEPNQGAAPTRNRGLVSAVGKYVYFFDSDDEISPTFFKECLPHMGRHDMICARTRMVFENGKTKTRWRKRPTTAAAQILGGVISTQTSLVNRNFIREGATALGCRPPLIAWHEKMTRWDDLEWGLRLILAHPSIKWLDHVHHRIHRHADSISGPTLWEDRTAVFYAILQMKEDLDKLGNLLTPRAMQQARNALWARTLIVCRTMEKQRKNQDFTSKEKEFIQEISNSATAGFRHRAHIIATIWPMNFPGLWRILLAMT